MRKVLAHLSKADPNLGGLIKAVGPCRLVPELDFEPFQALAHAIAHQQLHGTAAKSILNRFIETCGHGRFPSPTSVLAAPDQTLRAVGFSASKTAALKDLAQKAIDGIIPVRKVLLTLDDEAIIERLTQVRGIGRWTVEMMLIFQLGRPDVLPVDDFGICKGFQLTYALRKMPRPKVLAAYGARWAPYRSTAAWYFWRALELDKAGTLPAPSERVRLPRLPIRRKPRVKNVAGCVASGRGTAASSRSGSGPGKTSH